MGSSTLHWYADRGFELDVDAKDDKVAILLEAVPVPADGTAELREGVDLDRLDILFKASVAVRGEPAQLQEARVRLVKEGKKDMLAFEARCEDLETGEIIPVSLSFPVKVDKGVPARGGPRPVPTNEDDLDWEDDTTLEQMVVNAPERTDGFAEDAADDADEPEPEEEPKGPAKGLQALLKALSRLDDEGADPPTADEPTAEAAIDPVDESQPTGSDLSRDAKRPAEASDQSLGEHGEALSLLQLLIDNGHLELEGDAEPQSLTAGAAEILALPLSSEERATRFSGWLLEQEEVADLFIDDDDLAELLERW